LIGGNTALAADVLAVFVAAFFLLCASAAAGAKSETASRITNSRFNLISESPYGQRNERGANPFTDTGALSP
jgi:hypothetical protein